jgi:predicted nucleic acid-binding protein
VAKWIEGIGESLLFLSVLTTGAIRKGVSLLPQGRRRAVLEAWLENDLTLKFSGCILPIDFSVADRWGRISASASASGFPIPVIDGLLAGTAMHYNLTIVSRDETFARITGVDLFNPWRA